MKQQASTNLSENVINEEFKERLGSYLEEIDKAYSNEHKSINTRPLSAVLLLIENEVIQFRGPDEVDYLQSEEFTALMGMAQDWYFLRYGDLAKSSDRFQLKGIALFRKNPMRISFPQTTSVVEEERKSSWMVYSTHVEEHEDIVGYFSSALDFDSLSEKDYEELFQSIDRVVFLTRSIAISTLSDTTKLDSSSAMMLKTVIRHIEKGIDDVLELGVESAVACWEFHLAIEKSFKVYIKQKFGEGTHGHDLNKLNEIASKHNKKIDLGVLKKLPSDKDAIKLRYVEMQLPIRELISIYLLTLEIVNEITKDLDRKIRLYNARILFNKPDWA